MSQSEKLPPPSFSFLIATHAAQISTLLGQTPNPMTGKTEVRLRRFDEVAGRFNVPGKFLLIQGEEISDSFDKRPLHINAGNVVELIQPRGGATMRRYGLRSSPATRGSRRGSARAAAIRMSCRS